MEIVIGPEIDIIGLHKDVQCPQVYKVGSEVSPCRGAFIFFIIISRVGIVISISFLKKFHIVYIFYFVGFSFILSLIQVEIVHTF